MSRTLDHLLEEVGGFGCFQFILIPLSISSCIMAICSMMFMVFGNVEPDWWCVSRHLQTNQSEYAPWDHSDTTVDFIGNNVSAIFPPRSFDMNKTDGVALNTCGLLGEHDGVCETIVFTPGLSTIVTEFQLVCDRAWISSLIISLQMVGVLFGASIAGQMADTYGRKKAMLAFTSVHAILNLIAAFSFTWQMFAVFRTLIGVTTGAIIVIAFVYPTEFLGVKWRAAIYTVPLWGIGSTTTSLIVWALPHWSHVHLLTAACTAACLPLWLFLPESVRWLIVKGHLTEAQNVLCRMAKWNKRNAPDVRSVQNLFPDIDKPKRKYSYFHIFSSWKMIKYSVLNGYMWVSCSVTYYGLSFGIKNLSGDFHLNFFLMACVEMPPNLVVYHLSGWFGRRWTIVGSALIASLSVFAIVPLSYLLSEEEAGTYINALCIVSRIGMIIAWSTMGLYLAELYPTVVRGIANGYCNTVARVGGIVAPYISSIGEPYIFYAIIGVGMMLTALSPLLMPETRGRPLQDNLDESSRTYKASSATIAIEDKNLQDVVSFKDEKNMKMVCVNGRPEV